MTPKAYEIYEPEALGDLSFATEALDAVKNSVSGAGFWNCVTTALGDVATPSYFFPDTEDAITDWRAIDFSSVSWPITAKITFNDDDRYMALGYCYGDYLELHLPERYLLTGELAKDEERFSNFWRIESSFRHCLQQPWAYVEWAGENHTNLLAQPFAQMHRSSVYKRADCDVTNA